MMPLPWLQGANGSAPKSWECGFCRRRSRREDRIILTVDNSRAGYQRLRFCDLECLRHLLALWEERENKLKCVGCGEDFTPHDGRQKYHDEACRKLTWSRSQSTKERQEVNNA